MNATIVDASAITALLMDEPDAAAVQKRLSGRWLIAPELLEIEIANMLLTQLRRKRQSATNIQALYRIFQNMPIRLQSVAANAAFAIGQETGLTAYDATYLCLAEALGADLVTLDRQLDAAWLARRVPNTP